MIGWGKLRQPLPETFWTPKQNHVEFWVIFLKQLYSKNANEEKIKMLQTVKAEVNVDGSVRLLEPVRVSKTSPAILTVLDESGERELESQGNISALQRLINSPEFVNRKSYPAEEIDAQIQELRNSWD
jgi:hypothetical protein